MNHLKNNKILAIILMIILFLGLFTSCKRDKPIEANDNEVGEVQEEVTSDSGESEELNLAEDGIYNSKDDVALYIHLYGHLPGNYITKSEARSLGWSGGSVEKFGDNLAIGGDRFGNYEGSLPNRDNYYECDIDTWGRSKRGAKRIVWSDKGEIYYTEDHYESFEQLYEGG